MPNILIVGGSRGLGAALAKHYSSQPLMRVYATSRKDNVSTPSDVKWLTGIDLTKPDCGEKIATQLKDTVLSTVFITAGIFQLESFEEPKWDVQVATYLTSAIAPPFIISELFRGRNLATKADPPCKVMLVSSEAGSIALNQAGGGGNYAHHASKSALNMVGTQLRYDLEPYGIAVGMIHPSFMRTEMTKGVGFDVAYEENDALTPEQAAEILAQWTDEKFDLSKTGQFWAPRGSRDIGSWNAIMGDHVQGPVRLPW